jgi:predicted nucleotidyltransferase component of viral defense system
MIMVDVLEIKKLARIKGLPVSTIERDIAQIHLLKDVRKIDMVFKGGTCLQKVFFSDYRFSDDLDFTLLRSLEPKELEESLKEIATLTTDRSGIPFEFNGFQEVKNGFVGKFNFRMVWFGGNPINIKIDLTSAENEEIILPPQQMKIKHDYDEIISPEVLTYDLMEIFAEKVRSLFQRTRPRDLYDVSFLKKHIDLHSISKLVKKKFETKDLEIDLDIFNQKEEDLKRSWETSLRHQIVPLPDFKVAFKNVYELLVELE